MSRSMHKEKVSADRWSNRAISPLDFNSQADRAKPTVVVHPGWGKRPEMLSKLLFKLADAGFMPIGVDTRFGYCDQKQSNGYQLGDSALKLFQQSYRASALNPFFVTHSNWENRYCLRRPTGLGALCLWFGIEEARMVGHSEGGRIVTTLAADTNVLHVPKLVLVNAVGTGRNTGARGMTLNFRRNEAFQGTMELRQATLSALESTAHFMTHPRRSLREKRVIDEATDSTWSTLDRVASRGTAVTVLHARNDQLIKFADSEAAAALRSNMAFIATKGGHSNIYTDEVTDLIVEELAA